LPTLRGLGLFLFIGVSLYFSFIFHAQLEQWFSFLMILFTLVHLMDANDPFRQIEVEVLPFDPPFAGLPQSISIVIQNTGNIASENLWICFQDQESWIKVSALATHAIHRVQLNLTSVESGRQVLPKIRLKTRPKSELFQLWKVFETDVTFTVLPKPIDQGVSFDFYSQNNETQDQDSLEEIRDPRFFYQRDPKLFLKTGKSFLRKNNRVSGHAFGALRWESLSALGLDQKNEQFSYWLSQIEKMTSLVEFEIDTPFFKGKTLVQEIKDSRLKNKFADWVTSSD
jgi:hypothetical protein